MLLPQRRKPDAVGKTILTPYLFKISNAEAQIWGFWNQYGSPTAFSRLFQGQRGIRLNHQDGKLLGKKRKLLPLSKKGSPKIL
jgi:hypothetical protein